MYIYKCSAVVRDVVCIDDIQAVSDRQAWYFFSKKNGFKSRDFKILDKTEIVSKDTQLSFNI